MAPRRLRRRPGGAGPGTSGVDLTAQLLNLPPLVRTLADGPAPPADAVPTRPAPWTRQRQVRLEAEAVAALIARYLGGEPVPELAAAFGISETTLYAHLERARVGGRQYRKLWGSQLEEAIARHAAGESVRAIARELGLHRDTVRRALQGAGVDTGR